MSDDFNIKITVRNARLIEAIEQKFGSQSAFARAIGRHQTYVNALVTFRIKPIGKKGWTKLSLDVCAALDLQPDEIWPEHLEELKLKRPTAELKMGMDGVSALLSNEISAETKISQLQAISELSKDLSDRHRKALILFYVKGKTLREMGKELGVTYQRAKQIRQQAERKMRKKAVSLGYYNSEVVESASWPYRKTQRHLNSNALDLLEGN